MFFSFLCPIFSRCPGTGNHWRLPVIGQSVPGIAGEESSVCPAMSDSYHPTDGHALHGRHVGIRSSLANEPTILPSTLPR